MVDVSLGLHSYQSVYFQCGKQEDKVQQLREKYKVNLSFTAPAPKGLPEAVLNDRGDSLHAEALRRKEVKRRNIRRGGTRDGKRYSLWENKYSKKCKHTVGRKNLKTSHDYSNIIRDLGPHL